MIRDIEMLQPTISLPVTVVLFDLGKPGEIYQENGQKVEELPNHPVIDPKLSDAYLHGGNPDGDENNDEAYSNAEEKAFHESLKNKKKPRSRVRKEALPEQQAAA